jgi:ATP-dependent Lon protease
LTTVFVPKRNEPDLDDVPADVLETITIVPTTDVSELVALAIEPISSADDTRVAA